MDELRQNETRIATLIDTETDCQVFSDVEIANSKREEAKKKLFNIVEIKPEKKVLPKQSISFEKEVFVNEELNPVVEPETNLESLPEIEPEIEENIEEESETATEQYLEKEIEEETQQIEKKLQRKKIVYEDKKKPSIKLRLKLATCAIVCILTCLGGWAIYNAVEIKTLTGEAQAKNAQYNINVVKVISNTSKLDDLTNPNSITNLDELEKADIVQIIPKDKTLPQTIEKQSNWFDRVCNWLSNLFK